MRAWSNISGTLVGTCASLPFGETTTCTGPPEYLFTGKERDSESGNDYFGARYYSSSMGRWMSPDWASDPTATPYASYANPQSLNLYMYVGNNPLINRDADGHTCPGDPGCDIAAGLAKGFQGLLDGTNIKNSLSGAWDNAKNLLGIDGGKITTLGGTTDLTTTVTTGNIQTTSAGDQTITAVPGVGVTADATFHAPGAAPGPVSVSAGTPVVSVTATNSSVTVSAGFVAGPPVKAGLNGAVDANAASKAASSVASAARGLIAPTPPPPPAPAPPPPPPCTASASGHC
jgi:RHS repeat-associated protein